MGIPEDKEKILAAALNIDAAFVRRSDNNDKRLRNCTFYLHAFLGGGRNVRGYFRLIRLLS